MNVLVVDDSRAMRRLIRGYLVEYGFAPRDILEAGDGVEAIAALRERNIVLFSLILPFVLYPTLLWAMFTAMAFVEGQQERMASRVSMVANRIENAPDRYLDHVWGESEFGGTCVLYVSDVDLSEMGWSEQALAGVPSLTEPLVDKTPFIGLSVAGGLLAVNWIIQRRMRLATEQSKAPGSTNNPDRGEDNG